MLDRETADVVTGTVVIARRFRGPPESANGGYACGVLGCRLHGPARVRLDRPPPLDTPLQLVTSPSRAVLSRDADAVIARAELTESSWDVPAPVDFELAVQASAEFVWYSGHPFPSCFVCGPERVHRDGLRILPGAITDRRVVAAPWRPDSSVCDAAGAVQPEIVWAALDCPSWFGILAFEPGVGHALLGAMAARILRCPTVDERCVVLGWSRARAGRKLYGGAAIYGPAGELLASSAATWIELKPSPPRA